MHRLKARTWRLAVALGSIAALAVAGGAGARW